MNARITLALLVPGLLSAQNLLLPWTGSGHDAQHTSVSVVPSQPLNRIKWQTPVDLNPQYTGNDLLVHYGSPVITAANTVFVPVKTGATDGFRIDAFNGSTGGGRYTLSTDYSLPPYRWTPSFGPVLTARNRLIWAGAGGTVFYRDQPDAATGPTGRIAFYGLSSYLANTAAFNANVKISTPLVGDRYGNVFFGYVVLGSNPLNLVSGVAKIDYLGNGSLVTAFAASGGDTGMNHVAMNSTPALSVDHRTLYFAVTNGNLFGVGYLAAVNAITMAPLSRVLLVDPKSANAAFIPDDGTASPTVGPDGDVYFGVLENPFPSNHARGWLLHFNAALSQAKTRGAFGWDATASVVGSTLVPSYSGTSKYLLLIKYNNYASVGGDGVNRVAILDPNTAQTDPVSGIAVMKEVIAVAGPTPDDYGPSYPNAVREWCINSAAVDPFNRVALINSEDGILYKWDFASNSLTQSIVLTPGIGEAYTPTLIGVDGTVYAINNAILFAVGQ